MENECNYYFLTSTAQQVWQSKDGNGQNRMFACLSAMHKEPYFKKVIYTRYNIPGSKFRELGENAFLSTWEAFNKNGMAGKIAVKDAQYVGYFFSAFKNNYLKLLEKDIRQKNAEDEFKNSNPGVSEPKIEAGEFFSPRTQNALNKISPDCRELLIWKHVESLSHDEISRRKNITRESSIKMVSRCGRRFLQWWRINKN